MDARDVSDIRALAAWLLSAFRRGIATCEF
jgi:hypothetical protein